MALTCALDGLAGVPELPGDNALPRWLAEAAGYEVTDLRRRWRLAIDVDGPLDAILAGVTTAGDDAPAAAVRSRLERIRTVAADPHAELLVAGRTSAATLGWLERHTPSRTRALVEERGLRTARPDQRPPSSVLGALLDHDGVASFGATLARLADAALVDTRVLLAHRLGADERSWPPAEDRFASDLLLPDRVVDPWLRDLTRSALEAPIPVLLGGHTLVGPGVRLVGARLTVELVPGIRREPPTDLADVGEDEVLAAAIRDEIRRDGPMPFARFMQLALYDPDGGYYRSDAARPGRSGDFITAPELHPIFGATLSGLVVETWERLGRPSPMTVREYGAGTGALAAAMLDALGGGPLAGAVAL